MSATLPSTDLSKKHILIAVAGLTPQIITETLYYFMIARPQPIPIAEVWVLTTAIGLKKVQKTLLEEGTGKFYEFCRDCDIDPKTIWFDQRTIIPIDDDQHQPLPDIRTVEDNTRAAAQIFDFVRKKTQDPNTVVHCTIAGGRKTMGLYLGLALQFFGRDGDTLSHVLVNEEFENQPNFFYKPSKDQELEVWDREHKHLLKVLNTRDARIELAEIPYIHLNRLVDLPSLAGLSYEEIVARTQQEIDRAVVEPTVVVDLKERKLLIAIKGQRIDVPLPPKEIALYAHHASNVLEGRPWETVPELLERESEIRAHYEQTRPSAEALKIDKEIIRQLHAKINRKIKSAVKDDLVAKYCRVESQGPRAATTYGLRLDRSKVTFA